MAQTGAQDDASRLVETCSPMLLGLPVATVGTRLARGRERLRQSLKEEIE